MAWRADPAKKEAGLSFLLTLAVCANLLELFLPAPPFLPWLKPGFANAFTMTAIVFFGPVAGLQLALLRSLIAAALSGLPVTSLCLSGAGGLVSAGVMGLLWQAFGKQGWISLVGLGMAGAFAHTLTQLIVIYLLFVKNTYVFWQLPVLGPAAAVTGALTGLLAMATVRFMESRPPMTTAVSPEPVSAGPPLMPIVKLLLLVVLSTGIFLLPRLQFQVATSVVLFLVLAILKRPAAFPLLLRFLPLLTITFLLNAFTEPGTLVPVFPWVTFEGLAKGGFLAFRLINLIALSLNLLRLPDLMALLVWMKERFPAFAPSVRIALRGIAGIPLVTAAVRAELSTAPKGLVNRVRHLWRRFPDILEAVLVSPPFPTA